eukprot:1032824-Rhodomonas_salina.1
MLTVNVRNVNVHAGASTVLARAGSTGCEATRWVSASIVHALSAHGVRRSELIVITAGAGQYAGPGPYRMLVLDNTLGSYWTIAHERTGQIPRLVLDCALC